MIKPLFDQVLIERIEKKSESNLTIPESAQMRGDVVHARVVARGQGNRNAAAMFNPSLVEFEAIMKNLWQVQIGDIVLVRPTDGVRVDHEGKKYQMVLETEILGVVTSPQTT